jgi:hypothetical protein
MYTHARQFPHFAGMTDDQIRAVAKKSVAKAPRYSTLARLRIAIWLAIVVGVAATSYLVGIELGIGIILAAAVGFVFAMTWNLVWINTTLFRITFDEMRP